MVHLFEKVINKNELVILIQGDKNNRKINPLNKTNCL